MPVEVDAAEGEPPRRDAENRARDAVLVSACIRGIALGEEACSPIPASRRRARRGIEGEHGEKLHLAAGARPSAPSRRRATARRRRSGARERRSSPPHYHRGLGGRRAGRAFAGWRRVVPSAARRRLRPVRSAYVEWRRRRPLDLGDLRRTTPIDAELGLRARHADRSRVRRAIRGRSRGRHPRSGSRDRRARLHELGSDGESRPSTS